jgi:hypothetical protein
MNCEHEKIFKCEYPLGFLGLRNWICKKCLEEGIDNPLEQKLTEYEELKLKKDNLSNNRTGTFTGIHPLFKNNNMKIGYDHL